MDLFSPSPEYLEVLRRMTPGERFLAARRLYWTARELKAAALRQQFPEKTEAEIEREVRDAFLYSRD